MAWVGVAAGDIGSFYPSLEPWIKNVRFSI